MPARRRVYHRRLFPAADLLTASLLAAACAAGCGPARSPAPAPAAMGPHDLARPLAPALAPFRRTLRLQGVEFRVACANGGSINTLEIAAAGLEVEPPPFARQIDGTVAGAEVADLDGDGSPELYVYVTSAGSGSYGAVVAYAANRRRSLSEIHLPPIGDAPAAARGYRGHDTFAVAGSRLVRRFPLYRDGDPNALPTGGTRTLEYALVRGEAGWILRLERAFEE